jgi:hypothetical protein
VDKLLREAGIACAIYHDEHVRDLATKRVQVDEIWSFTYAKAKNVGAAKAAPYGAYTPDSSTRFFVEQAVEVAQEYTSIFTEDDIGACFYLLDDFHSSGRISVGGALLSARAFRHQPAPQVSVHGDASENLVVVPIVSAA